MSMIFLLAAGFPLDRRIFLWYDRRAKFPFGKVVPTILYGSVSKWGLAPQPRNFMCRLQHAHYDHFDLSLPEKQTWRRIEVVITALTRNQVASQEARGFESHRLRQKIPVHKNGNFFIQVARRHIIAGGHFCFIFTDYSFCRGRTPYWQRFL